MMNAIERDALIQALRNLREEMESARSEAPYEPDPGHLAALNALLAKAAPTHPELQTVSDKEPIPSIDTAIAYLKHAPIADAETDFQSLYDGILVSRLQKSKTIQVAFLLIAAIVFGGDIWLGYSTKGALQNIEKIEEEAIKELAKQSESSSNALSKQEKEVLGDLVRRRDQINEQTAEQLGRVKAIADNAETTIKAEILRASREVVNELREDAENTISQAESTVINGIRQTEAGAIQRITGVEGIARGRIDGKADQIIGLLDLEKQKKELGIQAKLGKVITDLERDTSTLTETLKMAKNTQIALAKNLKEREDDANRIEGTLEQVQKPGGVLKSVAAIADVAWALFGVMLIGFFIAAGAATAALFDWGKARLVRGSFALLLVVGVGIGGWIVGARWGDFEALRENVTSNTPSGTDTIGITQPLEESPASISTPVATDESTQVTTPPTSEVSETGS